MNSIQETGMRLRGLDFFNPEVHNTLPTTIIGCGGVGSNVLWALAKLGIRDITIFDADIIEQHNVGGQFFGLQHLNKPKVIAMEEICNDFFGLKINSVNKMWNNDWIEGIIISAVDSIEVRQKIFQKCKFNLTTPLLIDARVGGEICNIYIVNTINKEQCLWYENTLKNVQGNYELSCTGQWIFDMSLLIAGCITNVVRHYLTEKLIISNMIMIDGKNLEIFKVKEVK